MDEEYWKITESLKLIKIEKEKKERSTVTKDYINHLSTNVNLMREGQRFGEKKKLEEVEKVIDEMISFSEKKKKELKKKEADLIEIVPHMDYVTVLKELKLRLTGVKDGN